MYSLRKDFTVLGIVGRMGSGCSEFSKMISRNLDDFTISRYRSICEIDNLKVKSADDEIFKRQYKICYDYMKEHFEEYERIPYQSVLLFLVIKEVVAANIDLNYEQENEDVQKAVLDKLEDLLISFYTDDKKGASTETKLVIKNNILSKFNKAIGSLPYKSISMYLNSEKCIDSEIDCRSKKYKYLYDSFFDPNFKKFSKLFYKTLKAENYLYTTYFAHYLGKSFRALGESKLELEDRTHLKQHDDPSKIFTVVEFINEIIKAYKFVSKRRLICIDSFRNSLELMYLKERYSAFYSVAVHDNENHLENLTERIKSKNTSNTEVLVNKLVQGTLEIDEEEHKADVFNDGHFFAPDVETCIQKSEIHIHNTKIGKQENLKKELSHTFLTMKEQWLKYCSLIMHPGLITPTRDERCMHLAYSAKFNSGCISRQVGAVITDLNNSIRSVGWNEVPSGCVPCYLKDLKDLCSDEPDGGVYSSLESDRNNDSKIYKNNTKCFAELASPLINENVYRNGMHQCYCFKSLHNKNNDEKNQVHTRSLHAEENAMLQISKHGGQPLKGGKLYTTASPCELCAKKAYQLGLEIIYIDPYPGISMKHILDNGFNKPEMRMFSGVVGRAYIKLFEPFMAYKDELQLYKLKRNS